MSNPDPIDHALSVLLRWTRRGAKVGVFTACVLALYSYNEMAAVALLAFSCHVNGWKRQS
ncbi:MAG: hypothetical protein JSV86_13240 [Gemmatimonadota bacterium]|nr:MAG: hypothetical protein JSV86_13240 [Gemmatimonadota bacterium]